MSKESDKMEEFEKLLLDHEEAVRFSGSFTWISPTRECLLVWARAALSEPEAQPFGYVCNGYFYFNRANAERHRRNLDQESDIVPVYTHPKADADQRDGCALDVRADLPMTLARSIGFLEGQIHGIEQYAIWREGRQLVGCMERDLKDVLKPLEAELESLRKEPK